jgi:PAN domain
MRTIGRLTLSLAVSVIACVSGPAWAAQIFAPAQSRGTQPSVPLPYAPSDPPSCDVRLSGEIKRGDAEQFANIVDRLIEVRKGQPIYVCLNSNGGNVEEAIQIARYIRWLGRGPRQTVLLWAGYDSPIITVVEDRSVCGSACALVFMAGSALMRPVRFLHPRGELMFHSSFIDNKDLDELLKDPDRLPREIKQLYGYGLQDFRDIIRTFEAVSVPGRGLQPPWVKPSLFLEAFSQDPAELLCVDTIDQVGHWNIQLYGIALPKEKTKPMIRNACENNFYWQQDRSARVPRDASPLGSELPVFWTDPEQEIAGRNVWSAGFDLRAKFISRYNYTQCIVEMSGDAQVNVFYADFAGRRVSEVYDTPPFAFYLPDTVLQEISADRATASTPTDGGADGTPRAITRLREIPNSVISGCTLQRLHGSNADSCRAACDRTAECASYSFNKISRLCELKHTLNAMRRDPLWVSGIPSSTDANDIHWSTRPIVMDRPLPDPPGTYQARDLNGEKKADWHAPFRGQCDNKCDTDRECEGYSFYRDSQTADGGRCVLFSRIDSVTAGYADSAVKRQR